MCHKFSFRLGVVSHVGIDCQSLGRTTRASTAVTFASALSHRTCAGPGSFPPRLSSHKNSVPPSG